MMPPDLRRLGQQQPVRVLLINAGPLDAITWAGLVQPLLLAASSLGAGALQLDIRTPQQAAQDACGHWHIALLVADQMQPPLAPELCRAI